MAKTAAWQRPTSLRPATHSGSQKVLRLLIRGLQRTRILWMILLAFLFLSGCVDTDLRFGL